MYIDLEYEPEEYREAIAVSQSDLKACWENPSLYYRQHIAKDLPRKKATSAQRWGTMCENYLRTGELCVEVIPQEALSASDSRAGKNWERWKECHPRYDRAIRYCDADELIDTFNLVRSNIERHAMAYSILSGDVTWSHRCQWSNEQWPLDFKAELDIVDESRKIVVDVKTTNDTSARAFRSSVFRYGYDVQAAQYLTGMTHAGQDVFDQWDYLWLVIRNEEPYDVEVYRATPAVINYGARRRVEMIENYLRCVVSGEWVSATHGRVVDLDLPSYLGGSRYEYC